MRCNGWHWTARRQAAGKHFCRGLWEEELSLRNVAALGILLLPFSFARLAAAAQELPKPAARKSAPASKSKPAASASRHSAPGAKARSNAAASGRAATRGHSSGKGRRRYARRRQSWRTGQMKPRPERYKEIQQALIDKGYLQAPATGTWGPESTDALTRFQRDQKLEPSGKLDSLSLIALGLGPKRDLIGSNAAAGGSVSTTSSETAPQ